MAVKSGVQKVLENQPYALCAQKLRNSLAKTGGAEECVEHIERLVEHGFAEIVSRPPRMVDSIVPLTRPAYYAFLAAAATVVVQVVTQNVRGGRQMLQTAADVFVG